MFVIGNTVCIYDLVAFKKLNVFFVHLCLRGAAGNSFIMGFSSCLFYAAFDGTSTYGYKNIALLCRFFLVTQMRLSSRAEE